MQNKLNYGVWRKIFLLLKPKRILIMAVASCTLTIYVTSLVFPLTLQKGIDAALAHDLLEFHRMLAFSIAAALLEITLTNWRLSIIINLGAYLDISLSGNILKTALSRTYTTSKISPGDILNVTRQIKAIKEFTLNTVPQTALELGQAIIAFFLIAQFSKDIAILILATLIISAIPLKLRATTLPQNLDNYHTHESQKQNTITSLLSSMKQVKYHALESYSFRVALRHTKSATTSLRTVLKTSATIQLWSALTSRTLTFIVLIYGCIAVSANKLTIGEFMTIQLLASRLNSLIIGASDLLTKYQETKVTLQKIQRLECLPAEERSNKQFVHNFANTIVASNICSTHQNGKLAIENVSFKLPKSGLIVLTGISGSGKSTLANTLLGISGLTSGEIYYSGQKLSELNIRSLRKHISVTDQDNYIFTGTLRENLCCGRSIDNNEILHTLKRLDLLTFLKSLPEGLEHSINGNSQELSGGQKQKICLARAILRNNTYYILDEPTSALDSEARASILKTLSDLSNDNLVICLTHDSEIMKASDRILLLNNGSIIASGCHADLIKSCQFYNKLYCLAKTSA